MPRKLVRSDIVLRNTYVHSDSSGIRVPYDRVLLTAPEGYEFTGEHRCPNKDECYLIGDIKGVARAAQAFYEDERWILRPLETPAERRKSALGHILGNLFKSQNVRDTQVIARAVEQIERLFAEDAKC